MTVGQNLQYEERALSLVFIYFITYALIFFLLTMKDKLTSGMPENLEVILFAYFVLVFGGLKKSKWDFLVLL